jgi:hypothetical protein
MVATLIDMEPNTKNNSAFFTFFTLIEMPTFDDWLPEHDEHPLVIRNAFAPVFPGIESSEVFANDLLKRLNKQHDLDLTVYRSREALQRTPAKGEFRTLPKALHQYIQQKYSGFRAFPKVGDMRQNQSTAHRKFDLMVTRVQSDRSHYSIHHQDDDGAHGFHLLLTGRKLWNFVGPESRTTAQSVTFHPKVSVEQNAGDLVFISSGEPCNNLTHT